MSVAIIMKGGAGGVDCDSATAAPENVISGKTFGMSGKDDIQVGTMPVNTSNYSLPVNGKQIIPKGYQDGTRYVNQSVPTLGASTITPKTTDQTVSSGNYLTGNIYVPGNGNLISGNIADDTSIFGVGGSIHRYSGDQTVFNYGTYGSFLRWGVSYHMQNYESTASTYCRLENDHIYTKSYNTSTSEHYAYILSNRSFRFDQFSKIRITYSAEGTDSEGYGRTSYIRVYMTASDGSWRVGSGSQKNTGGIQVIESSIVDQAGNPLGSKQARLEIDVGHTEGRYPWVLCNIYKIEFLV